jgi:hypothetical protein
METTGRRVRAVPDSSPSETKESDDSDQVLTLLTNRPRREPALSHFHADDFGEAAPFTPRSGTRRKYARSYSSPPLLYQDFFRITRR